MSELKLAVGQTYKLVDASKDCMLNEAITEGYAILPEDGIITVHSLGEGCADGQVTGYSHTEGVGGSEEQDGDYMVIQQDSVDRGAFELVEE